MAKKLKRPLSGKICDICSKPDAGVYYKALACNGCRVFFFRAIKDNSKYVCSKTNDCYINYENIKTCCYACRLKKCYAANMQANRVNKRQLVSGLVEYFTTFAVDKFIKKFYGSTLNRGSQVMAHLSKMRSSAIVDHLNGFNEMILVRDGPTPCCFHGNPYMSAMDLLMYPDACIPRNTSLLEFISKDAIAPKYSYNFTAVLCRIMVANAEMASTVNEFHFLSTKDKICLLQNYGPEITMYIIQYEMFKGRTAPKTERFIQYFADTISMFLSNSWQNYVEGHKISVPKVRRVMEETQVTEKEMMMIRMIALFAAHPKLSDEGRAVVLQARIRLAQILGEYMKEIYPEKEANEIDKRLTTLLQMEKYAKESTTKLQEFIILMVIHNHEGMDAPLWRELFVTNT